MATYYVYSGAAGAGTGANWANAFTTLSGAFSGKAAGDIFYVAHDHAESQASAMSLTSPGTAAAPCRIICVNRAGSVPPVSADLRTTATITTTGANAISFGIQVSYYEGIIFSAGSGAVTQGFSYPNNTTKIHYKNCSLRKLGTSQSSTAINFGQSAANTIIMENTTVQFGANNGDCIAPPHQLVWRNTPSAIAGAVVPARLFSSANNGGQVLVEGVDISVLDSGEELVGAQGASTTFVFKDCKLGASVTTATAPSTIGPSVSLIRCDSGDTNYRTEKVMYQGTLTTETTTVRTGGASDGTTTIAWKIVPTANNERDFPFECFPISIWNETTGSAITLTIEGTWGGGAVPTTADIWMDVEYLGTSGVPLGSFTSGGPADSLASGTNHTASTETWGAGGTTKFKMAVSVTPQEKGPITVYIKYANVTNTVWIDPKITVS